MERKCYLIIDRKGIRGVYKELHTFSLFPKFKKVNIQWKSVASAEIMHTPVGRWGWVAGLAIFSQSNTEIPKEIITLNLLPVQKIVDSANYFYACYQEEKSLERQELISSFDLVVISEDGLSHIMDKEPRKVLNQWTYQTRMYQAARYICTQPDMELVQLVSFGCGIDAITTDEMRDILENNGKLYTQLKIDDISNLGAVKIRIRSLIAAMEAKEVAYNG